MPLTDISRVAQALNLTESRVHQLVKEGLPKEGRGQYDAVKCMLFYIRYLQAALEKKAVPMPDGAFAGEREERVRLLRADADMREIELAKERSQLVTIEDVEKEMADLILTTKARVMAVAPRVAPEVVGETSRVMVQAKIEKSLKEALLGLSKRGGKQNAGEAALPQGTTSGAVEGPPVRRNKPGR
jgi:phage terminase Nu1 subunit (DNA packaging protein)